LLVVQELSSARSVGGERENDILHLVVIWERIIKRHFDRIRRLDRVVIPAAELL